MFLLKLDFPSGNYVREEKCVILLVNISLKGVPGKDNQALEPNVSMGLQPTQVFGALLDASACFPQEEDNCARLLTLRSPEGSQTTEPLCIIFSELFLSLQGSKEICLPLRQCSLNSIVTQKSGDFLPSKGFHYSLYRKESTEVFLPCLTMWQ